MTGRLNRFAVCLIVWLICRADAGAAGWADPTRPALPPAAAGAVEETALPRVSAIVIHRRGRHALLDSTVVRVGQQWSGFHVVAIEPGKVTVRKGDRLIELPLVSQVKKTQR